MFLRRARSHDMELLWRWANDPETRARSFDPSPIPWDDHVAWFEKVTQAPTHLLLLGCDPEPVGLVRFERHGRRATISVNVAPESRGRGVGSEIIREGTQECFSRWRDLTVVDAHIKRNNTPSLAAFRSAGYEPVGPDNETSGGQLHLIHPRTPPGASC